MDFATAISLHPVVTSHPEEKRVERLKSPTVDDNRITYGCVNVAAGFYDDVVLTTLARGGVFYVLPEATPIEALFPALADEAAASEQLAAAGPEEAGGE